MLSTVGVAGVGGRRRRGRRTTSCTCRWTIALLIGAVLSSTDAAAVFSVLRRVPLPRRITGMLEAESGFNDAPVVLLVVALAAAGGARRRAAPVVAARCSSRWPSWSAAPRSAWPSAGGGGRMLRLVASASSALFSIGVLALTVLAYAVAALLHTSGFLAAYLAALVLGNTRLPHRPAVRGFAQALGWLAQIGLFVLLGPAGQPGQPDATSILPALGIGLVLLLLARPLSVIVSMTPVPDAVARAGVPVLGRAARRRAGRARHRPPHRRYAGGRRGCSTSSSSSS